MALWVLVQGRLIRESARSEWTSVCDWRVHRSVVGGIGQRVVGLFGMGVAAGRISKMRGQVWPRGLRDAGVDRCGGVVVEVDGSVGQPWVMAGYAKVVHAGLSWLPHGSQE